MNEAGTIMVDWNACDTCLHSGACQACQKIHFNMKRGKPLPLISVSKTGVAGLQLPLRVNSGILARLSEWFLIQYMALLRASWEQSVTNWEVGTRMGWSNSTRTRRTLATRLRRARRLALRGYLRSYFGREVIAVLNPAAIPPPLRGMLRSTSRRTLIPIGVFGGTKAGGIPLA